MSKYLKQRAFASLIGHLESNRIQYRLGDQLVVITKAGQDLPVNLSQEQMQNITGAHGNGNRERALADVTEAAGFGRLAPVRRGTIQVAKGNRRTSRPYGDDLERVIFREAVLKTVPNPPTETFTELDTVVNTCCRFFYRKNEAMCLRLGFDLQDLKTYAQVWTVNFWGTGRVLKPTRADDNQRMLYKYLRQRFAELYKQFRDQRTRNTVVDRQALAVGLGYQLTYDSDSIAGDPSSSPAATKFVSVTEEEMDEDELRDYEQYRNRHLEIDTGDDIQDPEKRAVRRRNSARDLLTKKLATLPHDTLLETLRQASESVAMCPDTKKEALKQLKLHRVSCSTCSAVPGSESGPVGLPIPGSLG